MEMQKLNGHSYFLRGGTNSGLYLYKDKFCLLVDPGLSPARGRRMANDLNKESIRTKYIYITHEHSDHYGASDGVKDVFPGVTTIAPEKSKVYIENPDLFNAYVYGGNPNKVMESFFKNRGNAPIIDQTVTEGEVRLNDKKFMIYELAGHCPGQSGILTEDKILYAGDSVFDESILSKYDFPFIYDIEAQKKTLEKIEAIDFDYIVLGHGPKALTKEEAKITIELNKHCIDKYLEQIREFSTTPVTREELLKYLIEYNELDLNYKEYHFYYATLGSMITYLMDKEEMEFSLESGKLFYYNK